ncbi:hypothetical protein Tco_1519335, partial [Tanacetum coccineum]
YFSEDYDEEGEMEPRPEPTREVTPPLSTRSPRVRRQRKRVVEFEEAPNREGRRTGRNTKGNKPSEAGAEENERWEMNLPLLLAAHLGRNENGQPLQSSLTFVYEGRHSSINIGGNLPLNGIINGQTPSFPFQAQTVDNIKQREGESVRDFATRYTDDTLQILGLHEDQHNSGFVHGLRKQEKLPLMEPRMIGGITSKGQGNPPGITVGDRKVETSSPLTRYLITDCSTAYLKVKERFSPRKK